jgi:hypothetical protein
VSGQLNGPGEFRDPMTGHRIEQLTVGPADHWLPAAPDTSLTPAGDYLLLLARPAGAPHPTLCRREMRTGAIEPVIEADRLVLNSIVPAANSRQAIALLRGEEGEVAAIDLETGEWETLAVFLDADLEGCHRSASGEYVVTVVTRGEEAIITAVHTEGMRTVPILEAARGVHSARFSPDSRNSVRYLTDNPPEIRSVEFDGTGDRVLASRIQAVRPGTRAAGDGVRPPTGPNFPHRPNPNARTPSPAARVPGLNARTPIWRGSGEEVLFIAGEEAGPILAVPRAGGGPRTVSSLPCSWLRSDGPGERLVAVAAAAAGGESLPEGRIVLLDPASGDAAPLVSRCVGVARPCFSPDGQSVFYSGRDDAGFTQIYQVRLDDMPA